MQFEDWLFVFFSCGLSNIMAKIENGWFYEFIKVYHGQAMSLQIEDILVHQESKFQDILVFKRCSFRAMVLKIC